jgi:hypothetical protein
MKIGTIKSDVSGPLSMLRSVVRALQPPHLGAAVDEALKVYEAGIQSRAPRRSGQLAASFQRRMTGATIGEVGSDLIYARPQEFGAWIAPKSPHVALKFTGSGVFVRRPIRLKPQPYVGPTFQQDTPRAEAAFMSEIDRAISSN